MVEFVETIRELENQGANGKYSIVGETITMSFREPELASADEATKFGSSEAKATDEAKFAPIGEMKRDPEKIRCTGFKRKGIAKK